MKAVWSGSIVNTDGSLLDGITMFTAQHEATTDFEGVSLRLLSVVETARIPLHMVVGKPYHVTATQTQTESYFASVLLDHLPHHEADFWWQISRADSPLAILAAVDYPPQSKTTARGPRMTELLFYASIAPPLAPCHSPPTPPHSSPLPNVPGVKSNLDIKVHALPLSSKLLQFQKEPTPPSSPRNEHTDAEATFLLPDSPQVDMTHEIVNELQPRKRRTVNEAFDEAAERKRKARRKGGEGVAAAAAYNPETALPALKHRRSVSNTQPPLQNRPSSRASSISSTRQTMAFESSLQLGLKPSGLSKCKSASALSDFTGQSSTEQKNKEYISKMVMSGMRLRGLVQSKSRKSRANSGAASPALVFGFDDIEDDRKNDEEYKLVYHQVYKGSSFAFREHISITGLQGHTIAVQETVERLLAIFLNDPLVVVSKDNEAEFTPGGRKAFGSSVLPVSDRANPFLRAIATDPDSRSNTPCTRKLNDGSKAPT